MPQQSHADAIRGYFDAYRRKDKVHIESALAENFTFTSPYDDSINKAEYFRRCWPNSNVIMEHIVESIIENDDSAFVTYTAKTNDGKEFRNTEYMTFEGDKLKSVDVYFGASYKDGTFVRQQP